MSGSKSIGLWIVLLFNFSIFFACAEPKYAEAPSEAEGKPSEKEAKATCAQSFQKSGLCLTWYWEKRPATTNEMGSLIFKVYRLNRFDQTPIETDTAVVPQLALWMPSMGHGSSPTVVSRLDQGTYRASDVLFVMRGDWELKFQVKEGNELDDVSIFLTF